MKRKLLLPIIFSQAINAQAWSTNEKLDKTLDKANSEISSLNDKLQALCGTDRTLSLEAATNESNRLWKEIVAQVNNARIKFGFDEAAQLTDRSSISLEKDTISEAISNGKYLGIDKWRLAAGVSLLGTKYADLGVSGAREVTFIQQFPTRCKSLVRLGYDPITKVPLDAERALTRLKPGDFVAFSSPLTIGLGKSIAAFIENTDVTKSLGGVSIYATGEFNIHVYRMENNYVRVRFFAAKTKGIDFNPGIKFYGLSGLLKITPLELELGKALTNLFSADYVFNLNDEEGRKLYDSALGEKFDLKKVLGMPNDINPFASENSIAKKLYSDLKGIEQASLDEMKKPIESRRVIRLSQGDTETKSSRTGINVDLILLKLRDRTTLSDGFVSFYDVTNQNQRFLIKTISTLKEFKAFEYWGQEDSYNTAMLIKTDDRQNLISSAGLQSIRAKEELSLSKDEIRGLRNRLQRLPEDIRAVLNLPDPDKLKGDVARARIEQSIFFDTQNLEQQGSITYKAVESELKNLISNWGEIDSIPVGLSPQSSSDGMVDPRAESLEKARLNKYWSRKEKNSTKAAAYLAKANAELLEAYSHELEMIPRLLSGLFGKDHIKEKAQYHAELQAIPLFNEIGITLVLNLISQADKAGNSSIKMKDVVSYRLSVTGRGIEPKISEYPVMERNADGTQVTSENLKKSEIFQRVLNDNAYMTDRSFNLRYYMNEKGDSLSLKEVVTRATAN